MKSYCTALRFRPQPLGVILMMWLPSRRSESGWGLVPAFIGENSEKTKWWLKRVWEWVETPNKMVILDLHDKIVYMYMQIHWPYIHWKGVSLSSTQLKDVTGPSPSNSTNAVPRLLFAVIPLLMRWAVQNWGSENISSRLLMITWRSFSFCALTYNR